MKICPNCHRTYADETLTFCLVDGSILSAPFDPKVTWQMPAAHTTNPPSPTEVWPGASLPKPLVAQPRQSSPGKIVAIAAAAILASALVIFFVLKSQRTATISTTPTNKPANTSSPVSQKPPDAQTSPTASTPDPAPEIPAFTGSIADGPDKGNFFDFLAENERKLVNIDVNLSDEQMAQIKDYPSEEKGLYVDLSYTDDEGSPAGAQLLIDLSGGEKDLHLDERPTSQRLQSYLKIIGVQGPQQGIFTVNAVPVSIESVH